MEGEKRLLISKVVAYTDLHIQSWDQAIEQRSRSGRFAWALAVS